MKNGKKNHDPEQSFLNIYLKMKNKENHKRRKGQFCATCQLNPGVHDGSMLVKYQKVFGSGGIRTHASEETGALNQRLRPLGHATLLLILGHIPEETTGDRM